MKLKFEFPEDTTEEIKAKLIDSLNIKENELKSSLEKIAKSALWEYIDMIVGVGIPSRIIDVQQSRIIKLIYHYYGTMPSEEQISKVFNVTRSKSKTLLNNVKSVYRNQLKEIIKESIKTFLQNGEKKEASWEFILSSKTIIQELNEYLEVHNPGLEKIVNKSGSIAKVDIPIDTFEYLCNEFKVKIEGQDE